MKDPSRIGIVVALGFFALATDDRVGFVLPAGVNELKETFFGQPVPGAEPVLFAPDVLISDLGAHGRLTFSPEGREMFWSGNEKIYYAAFDGKKLSSARVAPFVDSFRHDGPVFSRDGRTLYFTSNRGLPNEKDNTNGRIWRVVRDAAGWSRPVLLTDKIDYVGAQISMTDEGRLFFTRRTGNKRIQLCVRLLNGNPSEAEPLRFAGDQELQLNDLYVDPYERFLLASTVRSSSESFRMADLVISFKQDDGAWGEFRLLNEKVNTDCYERFPGLSSDGRFLFFVRSSEAGSFRGARYYWVAAETLGIPGFPLSKLRSGNKDTVREGKGEMARQELTGPAATPRAGRKACLSPSVLRMAEDDLKPMSSKGWAEMIRKVDPMVCPKCRATMKVVAFITDYPAVDRIIDHLKLRFVAEKPPPSHVFQQVALMAAEERTDYF